MRMIYIVGSYKYGSRHKSIIAARKKAYALIGRPNPDTNAHVTITKLGKDGFAEMWNTGEVSRYGMGAITYTEYDKQRIAGVWFLNKDGTLGKRIG